MGASAAPNPAVPARLGDPVSELEADPPAPLLRLPSIETVVALRGPAGCTPPPVEERLGTGWNWEKAGGKGADLGGGKAPWTGRFGWKWGKSEFGALIGGMGRIWLIVIGMELEDEARNCCRNWFGLLIG